MATEEAGEPLDLVSISADNQAVTGDQAEVWSPRFF